MLEYIVDCELRPIRLDGRRLVAPYTTASHVHEQIIRCRDCDLCKQRGTMLVCELREEHHFRTHAMGFCDRAKPKAGA